jgi:diguanylate cyclase (GGDEF)-like protein
MTLEDVKLHDEPGRLAALHRYEILDTPKESSFERITGLVKTVLNVPMCAVSLIDTDRQWFKSCVGLTVSQTTRNISFCTHTIMERQPLHIPDATLDARFAENPLVTGDPFIRSYLGVPLSTPDGYNIGSLCAIDTKARTFSIDQIAVLQSFAMLVVDELELRRVAQTDQLTGAATRRSFCLELEKAIAHFRRTGVPSTLVMLDVDHFKLVNDTYGHPAGDVVLRTVAAELMGELRENDVLGRLGGEEFGVLLRESAPEYAMAIAERFRVRVEAADVSRTHPIRVTASLGVSPLPHTTLTAEQWVEIADQAMYLAKRTGRNRCCTTLMAKALA